MPRSYENLLADGQLAYGVMHRLGADIADPRGWAPGQGRDLSIRSDADGVELVQRIDEQTVVVTRFDSSLADLVHAAIALDAAIAGTPYLERPTAARASAATGRVLVRVVEQVRVHVVDSGNLSAAISSVAGQQGHGRDTHRPTRVRLEALELMRAEFLKDLAPVAVRIRHSAETTAAHIAAGAHRHQRESVSRTVRISAADLVNQIASRVPLIEGGRSLIG